VQTVQLAQLAIRGNTNRQMAVRPAQHALQESFSRHKVAWRRAIVLYVTVIFSVHKGQRNVKNVQEIRLLWKRARFHLTVYATKASPGPMGAFARHVLLENISQRMGAKHALIAGMEPF
jgi:hypothetical protein